MTTTVLCEDLQFEISIVNETYMRAYNEKHRLELRSNRFDSEDNSDKPQFKLTKYWQYAIANNTAKMEFCDEENCFWVDATYGVKCGKPLIIVQSLKAVNIDLRRTLWQFKYDALKLENEALKLENEALKSSST